MRRSGLEQHKPSKLISFALIQTNFNYSSWLLIRNAGEHYSCLAVNIEMFDIDRSVCSKRYLLFDEAFWVLIPSPPTHTDIYIPLIPPCAQKS